MSEHLFAVIGAWCTASFGLALALILVQAIADAIRRPRRIGPLARRRAR